MRRPLLRFENIPSNFFPLRAYPFLFELTKFQEVDFIIVKSRKSKLGDFKTAKNKLICPRISINGNLNSYAFLITFLHEWAHYLVWKEGHIYSKPHGNLWKTNFKKLILLMIENEIFPQEISASLLIHIQNPKASSTTDINLFKALSSFDTEMQGKYIDELIDGDFFKIRNNLIFKREKKLRKRILCMNMTNKKKYLFNPIYKVYPINNEEYFKN